MNSRIKYFLTAIGFGFLFLLFTFIVKKDKFTKIDFDITVKIQDHVPFHLDALFSSISFIASFEISLFILIILLIFRKRILGLGALALFALGHLVEIYGKVLLDHPSPPMKFIRQTDTTLFPVWYQQPGSSYPSGHSFRITFIVIVAIFLLMNFKRLPDYVKYFVSFLLLIFVVLTLFSRVYLGTHWFSDVIGGALLGGNLAFLSLILL